MERAIPKAKKWSFDSRTAPAWPNHQRYVGDGTGGYMVFR
jgi:hypothetical protein